MTNDFNVADFLTAAGGEIIGKVRFHKMVYLLDQLLKHRGKKESGLKYEYHYFGPFSEELAEQIEEAKDLDSIEFESKHREIDGAPYTIFHSKESQNGDSQMNKCVYEEFSDELAKMKEHTSNILEVAATIHWLVSEEKHQNWEAELERRKGILARNDRKKEARKLLKELGLPPEA